MLAVPWESAAYVDERIRVLVRFYDTRLFNIVISPCTRQSFEARLVLKVYPLYGI
jgi:hypothetical protein